MCQCLGLIRLLAGLCLAMLCWGGSFSGYLNDPGNTALIGSDLWTSSTVRPVPLFGSDWDIANNVALYQFTYTTATPVTFSSHGFAAGGVDPYFSLFSGADGSASLIGSNWAQAFSTGGDFSLTFPLGPGTYLAAIGVFANVSYAENLGGGGLSDGFIGLGEPGALGSYYYELELSPAPVPEPASLTLLGLILVWLAVRSCRKGAAVRTSRS